MAEFNPLNTIYYGPAGTGKTFKMQEIFGGNLSETTNIGKSVIDETKVPEEAKTSGKTEVVNSPSLKSNKGKGWDMIGGFEKNKYESIIMSLLSIHNKPTGATKIIKLPFNTYFYKYFCGADTIGDFKQEIAAHSMNSKDLETSGTKLKSRFTTKRKISHFQYTDNELKSGDENQGITILDRDIINDKLFYIKNLDNDFTKKEIERVKDFFRINFGSDNPATLIKMANDVAYRNKVLNGEEQQKEVADELVEEPEVGYAESNENTVENYAQALNPTQSVQVKVIDGEWSQIQLISNNSTTLFNPWIVQTQPNEKSIFQLWRDPIGALMDA